MATVRHLEFLEIIIFNILYISESQFASQCQISCQSVKTLRRYGHFFGFSRWRLSATLHLLYSCLDHPRRAFGGLCHRAKFGWNRCSSCRITQILIVRALLCNTNVKSSLTYRMHIGACLLIRISKSFQLLQDLSSNKSNNRAYRMQLYSPLFTRKLVVIIEKNRKCNYRRL